MNILLAVIQLLLIGVIVFYEMKRRSIVVMFWGALLILFSLPHLIEILFGESIYMEDTLKSASIFSIGFMSIYLILRILSTRIIRQNNYLPEFEKNDNKILGVSKLYISLLILSTVIILLIAKIKFGGIFNASWLEFYSLNLEWSILNPVRYINVIFFTIAGVALYFRYKNVAYFIISLLCIFTIAFITGNRVMFIPLFMVFLIPFILKGKNISIIKPVFLGFGAILIVYIFYFMRVIRHTGSLNLFAENFDFADVNNKIFELIFSNDGELGLRNIFYYFIENNNNFAYFGEGNTYIRMLFVLIPSDLSFNLKPNDFAIAMGSAYSGNISNNLYSVHPTFFGDAFANFGYLGIFVAIIWVIIFLIIDVISIKLKGFNRTIFFVLCGTCLVIIARGSVYNGFFNFVVGIIILIILSFFSKLFRSLFLRKRNNGQIKKSLHVGR